MQVGAEPERRRRRGCVWAAVVLAVLLALGVVLGVMALGTPDLGAPPGGRDDGETQQAIATALAASLARQLIAGEHGLVTLSEHDLTVLVRENNPNPVRFPDPQVRVRDGLVVIDARTPFGPFTVDAVGRLALNRTVGADGLPQVSATVASVQVGSLGLPDFAAHAVQDRIQRAFDLSDVITGIGLVRSVLDCVRVAPDGVRLGFHRPGAASTPAACD